MRKSLRVTCWPAPAIRRGFGSRLIVELSDLREPLSFCRSGQHRATRHKCPVALTLTGPTRVAVGRISAAPSGNSSSPDRISHHRETPRPKTGNRQRANKEIDQTLNCPAPVLSSDPVSPIPTISHATIIVNASTSAAGRVRIPRISRQGATTSPPVRHRR